MGRPAFPPPFPLALAGLPALAVLALPACFKLFFFFFATFLVAAGFLAACFELFRFCVFFFLGVAVLPAVRFVDFLFLAAIREV